jgi:YrbI family 3-deoxy-D-manno-octulosonate 8-phosphate phosphatase
VSVCDAGVGVAVACPEPSTLAIIPARGGSKGIPCKNVRLLAGKPLLAYSIEHALAARSVTRVVVSTDDDEISLVALQWGAEVVRRPAEISGDTASSESALLHVLDHLRETEAYEPDLVVFLQATSPMRDRGDLDAACSTLISDGADSLFSACRVEGFTWRRSGPSLAPVNYDPLNRPRRQDLQETVLEENGSFYVFHPRVLRAFGGRLGGRIAVYEMPRALSFQIDEPADIGLLEALMAATPRAVPDVDPSRVGLVALDFDGVLTDNRVWVDQTGTESVACHRGDGWGLRLLHEAGVPVVVISTEANPVVAARCRKLSVECVQGCEDKPAALKKHAESIGVSLDRTLFMGNDVNDLPCLSVVGLPAAVADAAPEVLAVARYVTVAGGGHGAVRELADWLLSGR